MEVTVVEVVVGTVGALVGAAEGLVGASVVLVKVLVVLVLVATRKYVVNDVAVVVMAHDENM